MQITLPSAAPFLACVFAFVGCRALPSAHDVLADPASAARGRTDEGTPPTSLQRRAHIALDAARSEARATLEAVAAPGADAATRAAAAHALLAAAELGLHVALFEAGEAAETQDVAVFLALEDHLGDAEMRELLGLTRDAASLALEARAGLEADAALAALHDAAFASTLAAWAMGPQRALMTGAARQLKPLLAENVEAGPERAGAAPLRLQGRFLCRAPWPVGDRARGRALLQRAFEVDPNALNGLFLGDAAYAAGDTEVAVRAWRAAVDAGTRPALPRAPERGAGPESEPNGGRSAELVDELVSAEARHRLEALAAAAQGT